MNAFLGIDIGSISTKAVLVDETNKIIWDNYIWTEGNPIRAINKIMSQLSAQLSLPNPPPPHSLSSGLASSSVQGVNPSLLESGGYEIVGVGTTGSARKLAGAMLGADVVKNEITAHAIGTLSMHPDVRTIFEIGGQDSKIIIIEDGVVVDYAMNTLCAAGTGAFLSSQATRLGVEIEQFGEYALKSVNAAKIAARCTVFAESDLVHKAQIGYSKEDIIAGLCNAVVENYLNNLSKGKNIHSPIVFQGGVSKNAGVVRAFSDRVGKIRVDEKGHLMGALGIAILAKQRSKRKLFDFKLLKQAFETRGSQCTRCGNNCETINIYRNGKLIDIFGNRCPAPTQALEAK